MNGGRGAGVAQELGFPAVYQAHPAASLLVLQHLCCQLKTAFFQPSLSLQYSCCWYCVAPLTTHYCAALTPCCFSLAPIPPCSRRGSLGDEYRRDVADQQYYESKWGKATCLGQGVDGLSSLCMGVAAAGRCMGHWPCEQLLAVLSVPQQEGCTLHTLARVSAPTPLLLCSLSLASAEMMAGMKTMQYEELTEEQILAARRRRMQEVARWVAGWLRFWGLGGMRGLAWGDHCTDKHIGYLRPQCDTWHLVSISPRRDSAPLDLDKIEIPENHPFAVKKQLTPGVDGRVGGVGA